MTRAGLEVKVADILSRKPVDIMDDPKRNERHIKCKDARFPLSRQEKNTLFLYFDMIKFPRKIVFD